VIHWNGNKYAISVDSILKLPSNIPSGKYLPTYFSRQMERL
jgi:hypothetical protein